MFRFFPILVTGVFLVVIGISGCSDSLTCWPFCSSSTSSGVDNNSTADTTTDTTTDTTSLTAVTLYSPLGTEVFHYLNPIVGGPALNSIKIRWGTDGSGSVIIDLYKSGEFHYRINDSGDGYKQINEQFKWKPHKTIEPGSDYQIRIISPDDSKIYDMSDAYFTIARPTT